MVISFDELDNANNLKDGKPSNNLFIYRMTAYEGFTHFESYTPQYKEPKNGKLVSLALRIMHEKNNIITNGPVTTLGLHIQ